MPMSEKSEQGLRIAGVISSMWGAGLATVAAGVLVWFGTNFLTEFRSLRNDVDTIKIFMAVSVQQGMEVSRRIEKIEARVFP